MPHDEKTQQKLSVVPQPGRQVKFFKLNKAYVFLAMEMQQLGVLADGKICAQGRRENEALLC